MKITTSVRVGPAIYTVDFFDPTDYPSGKDGIWGSCNHTEMSILVDSRACHTRQFQTMIHEVVEAMNDQYDLRLKHHQVILLETAWTSFIRDNPEVFQ